MTTHPTNSEIVIVGGGISGLGVALEASYWGLSTVLLEQNTLCSQTSANSLRIIHGGLRYLQRLDLIRAAESLREQIYWRGKEPDLINPLPCYMPLRPTGIMSRVPLSIASAMYKLLGKVTSGSVPIAEVVTPEEVTPHVGEAAHLFSLGALHWQDALLVNPADFAHRLAQRARDQSALIIEGEKFSGYRVQGESLEVESQSALGEKHVVSTKVLINCTGKKFSSGDGTLEPTTQGCRGFNVIIDRKLSDSAAIGLRSRQGRLFFFVPRGGGTAIGTGYLPLRGDGSSKIEESEAAEFIEDASSALDGMPLTSKNIQSIESGILPLGHRSERGVEPKGKYEIEKNGRIIQVTATKYTTFRSQAEKVISMARPLLR